MPDKTPPAAKLMSARLLQRVTVFDLLPTEDANEIFEQG
jgi:hypothetical protein